MQSSPLSPEVLRPSLLSVADSMKSCGWRNDSTYIYLLRKIADVYFLEGDYLKTVEYRQDAIKMLKANAGSPAVRMKTLPAMYYWLSIAYDSLDNKQEKMRALDSCSSIAIRLDHYDRASLTAIYTQVEYYFDLGDYHRCIDYAAKSQAMAETYASRNTGIEKSVGESYISSSLGWEVISLLRLSRYEQAEALVGKKIGEFSRAGLTDYLGWAYGQMAEVQRQKGNMERVVFYYDRSLECYKKTGDHFNSKQTLKDLGYLVYQQYYRNGEKAFACYRRALQQTIMDPYRRVADKAETLNIYSNIGQLFTRQKKFDSAYHYYRMALEQVVPGGNEQDLLRCSPDSFARLKNVHYLSRLFTDIADTRKEEFLARGSPSQIRMAIEAYRDADLLLDKIRVGQHDLKSKLFWKADTRRLYENAIDACYMAADPEEAFYFFEKSRATLLLDQLTEQRWVGEKDISRLAQLQKRLFQLEAKSRTERKNEQETVALQDEIFDLKRSLYNLKQELRKKNPLYYQSNLDTALVNYEEVKKKLLNDHQALIEIFSGEEMVYVLQITATGARLKRVDKNEFNTLATDYIMHVSNPTILNQQFDKFCQISHRLYRLIFGDEALPAGRIIISPDRHYFPFESLVVSEPGARLRYFLADYAVSYTYSARFLMNEFSYGNRRGTGDFLGFAPVSFSSRSGLSSLQGSDLSLGNVTRLFSRSRQWVAGDATRQRFLSDFYRYKIIQLYTHSADSGALGEPVLYFVDSTLLLSDLIFEQRPATRLIVLSACETGEGAYYRGEGIFSFNRGFAGLGVPASVTNLWTVASHPTYLLTELFHKHLAKGEPPDLALQYAKLEYLESASKEESLPYYWAAPVMVGKTDVIRLEKPFQWKWVILFLPVIAGAFLLWRRRYSSWKRT